MRAKGIFLGVCLVAMSSAAALADPMGTGGFIVNVGETNGAADGFILFDDVTYPVLGGSANLSEAGVVAFTGQLAPTSTKCTNTETSCSSNLDCLLPEHCAVRAGTFVTSASSLLCSGCNADCTGCDAACPLCLQTQGSFICPPAGCTSNQPSSFVGTSSVAIGTALDDLPSGVTFTFSTDGTTSFQSQDCSGFQCVDTHNGQLGINAFGAIVTPVGSPSTITTATSFFNSSTGQQVTVSTSISFTNVSTAGSTTVTAISNAAGALPAGFAADAGYCTGTPFPCTTDADCGVGLTCDGYHAAFFDISTTATYSGPITVCSVYPDNEPLPPGGDGILDGTNIREGTLRMLHRANPNGDFVDVTLPGYPNTQTNEICGQVDSLSPFVIASANNIPGGGSPANDCVHEWSAGTTLSTDRKGIPKTKIVCKDNDPTCDLEPTTGLCAINVEICTNQIDARLPACTPSDIVSYTMLKPKFTTTDPYDQNNLFTLIYSILNSVPGVSFDTSQPTIVANFTPAVTSSSCLTPIGPMYVPLKNGTRPGKRVLKVRAATTGGSKDTDKLVLVCMP